MFHSIFISGNGVRQAVQQDFVLA